MRFQGAFPAKEFLAGIAGSEGKRVRARMLALAQRMADSGKLAYEHGHWLDGPYSDLFEFKPYKYRVLAFRRSNYLYVTNAAKKALPKVQNRDYDYALALRDDFLARLPLDPPSRR